MAAAIPDLVNPERLASLMASGLMDSPAEAAFDRLTALATAALRVPVALISLVDGRRQFFKSQCGLPEPWATARQTPLSHSFCQHVVTTAEPLLVEDARTDPRVRDNLAVPDIGVVAYAGVPLVGLDGQVLGALCAIDVKPRAWTADDVTLLRALSAQASAEVEQRARTRRLFETLEMHRGIAENREAMARLTVHDLRTPLSALLMSIELLPRLGAFNDRQRSVLSMGVRNGQVLLGLIDNLLDIGTVEHRGKAALQRETVRPADAIARAVEQVLPLATGKAIALTATPCEGVPGVFADVDKLVRVLVNLLGNAVKFTPAGGRIGVGAAVGPAQAGDDGAPCVEFAVRDTGVGVPPDKRIFDEGVRLDPLAVTRTSTGLGLTFCKRIVEAHGGVIGYESTPGVGSTFRFTVPATRA